MSSKQAKNFGSSETKIPACLTPVDNRKSLSCDTKTFPRSSQGGSNRAPLKTIQIILALAEECKKVDREQRDTVSYFKRFKTTKSILISKTQSKPSLGLLKNVITALQRNKLASFISLGEYVDFPTYEKKELCRHYEVMLPWWWEFLKNDGHRFYTDIDGKVRDRFTLVNGCRKEFILSDGWDYDLSPTKEFSMKDTHEVIVSKRIFPVNIRQKKARQKKAKVDPNKRKPFGLKKYLKKHNLDIDAYVTNAEEEELLAEIEHLNIDRRMGLSLLVKCTEITFGRGGTKCKIVELCKELKADKDLTNKLSIDAIKIATKRLAETLKYFKKKGRTLKKHDKAKLLIDFSFKEQNWLRKVFCDKKLRNGLNKVKIPHYAVKHPRTAVHTRLEVAKRITNSKRLPFSSENVHKSPPMTGMSKEQYVAMRQRDKTNKHWNEINRAKYEKMNNEGKIHQNILDFIAKIKHKYFVEYHWSLMHLLFQYEYSVLEKAIDNILAYEKPIHNINAFLMKACETIKSKKLSHNYLVKSQRLSNKVKEKIGRKQLIIQDMHDTNHLSPFIFQIENWRFFAKYDDDVFREAVRSLPKWSSLYINIKQFQVELGKRCKLMQKDKNDRVRMQKRFIEPKIITKQWENVG